MVAAAETSLYDWMMIISVVLGYIDQVTDLMFVFASRATWSLQLRVFAGVFIVFFLLVRTGMAVAQGRGLVGALLALTGAELAVRGWQAYHSHQEEAIERWKEVAGYISIESILEGIPLVFFATLYMFQSTDLCHFVTCDAATIARVFPSDVSTLPAERPISAAEVLAIHSHNPHCAHLPLTDDGWFTLSLDSVNAEYPDRQIGIFRKNAEMEIPGSAVEQITGAPSPSFACVGIHTRHPGTWTALALSSRALVPSLSILCGILCTAYHLSRMYSVDNPMSLWVLPTAGLGDPDALHMPGSSVVGATRSRRPSAAGARVHPGGGTPRRFRPSMLSIRSVLPARPELGPVVVHHAAAFACFAVDVAFIICLWVEIVHATLVAAPHVDIFALLPLALLLATGAKAWLVVGRFGRPWFAALGQIMWTVTPLRVTNPWTLRVAPRWGRYAAITVSIAVNGAILAMVTAVPALMARGSGYLWRISWGPLLVLWCMYAMHIVLLRLAFWTHARALVAAPERPGSAARAGADGAEVEMVVPVECEGMFGVRKGAAASRVRSVEGGRGSSDAADVHGQDDCDETGGTTTESGGEAGCAEQQRRISAPTDGTVAGYTGASGAGDLW